MLFSFHFQNLTTLLNDTELIYSWCNFDRWFQAITSVITLITFYKFIHYDVWPKFVYDAVFNF